MNMKVSMAEVKARYGPDLSAAEARENNTNRNTRSLVVKQNAESKTPLKSSAKTLLKPAPKTHRAGLPTQRGDRPVGTAPARDLSPGTAGAGNFNKNVATRRSLKPFDRSPGAAGAGDFNKNVATRRSPTPIDRSPGSVGAGGFNKNVATQRGHELVNRSPETVAAGDFNKDVETQRGHEPIDRSPETNGAGLPTKKGTEITCQQKRHFDQPSSEFSLAMNQLTTVEAPTVPIAPTAPALPTTRISKIAKLVPTMQKASIAKLAPTMQKTPIAKLAPTVQKAPIAKKRAAAVSGTSKIPAPKRQPVPVAEVVGKKHELSTPLRRNRGAA